MTSQTLIQGAATVQEVANYFLSKSKKGTEEAITHLKLQKLVYYAQAWHLALKDGQPLFNSRIEAWIHGPVCPTLYNDYRGMGYKELDIVSSPPELRGDIKEILDSVWEVYGSYDGKFLEELTHSEDPWKKARRNLSPDALSNNEISLNDMAEYYRE